MTCYLELRQAYNLFDTNKDGTLTPEEIKKLIAKVGLDLKSYEIDELIRHLDKNNDGSITFEGKTK